MATLANVAAPMIVALPATVIAENEAPLTTVAPPDTAIPENEEALMTAALLATETLGSVVALMIAGLLDTVTPERGVVPTTGGLHDMGTLENEEGLHGESLRVGARKRELVWRGCEKKERASPVYISTQRHLYSTHEVAEYQL